MATLRIESACSDGGTRGRGVLVMVFATCVLSCACLGGIARAECIDYGSYLHWVSGVNTPDYAYGVAISGSHAYVADGVAGLQVIDITDPASPQLVGGVDTPYDAAGVAISGSHAYVADVEAGLQVIDITDPASPQLVGGVDTPGRAYGVAISGSHAYVADGSAGLQVAPLHCDGGVFVYLVDLLAQRVGSSCVVRWSISQPQAHAGFRVWRQLPSSALTLLGEALVSGPWTYEYVDQAPPASAADYWLEEVTNDGSVNWYGPAHLSAAAGPAMVALRQNHPNPFNPRTQLRYSLPSAGRVALAVYDLRGGLVTTLVEAEMPAGEWMVEWDGLDDLGVAVPSGVYMARLATPAGMQTVKMMLTR